MLVTGIDEAGRGAVIGPMVVAGVTLEKRYVKKLKLLGVKDSKKLTPEKRKELSKEIEKIATHITVIKVPACRIDANRLNGISLDKTEAMKMAQIIQMSPKSKVYIDSLTHNPSKFEKIIRSFLPSNRKYNLVVKNYMDESQPVVSAASIIAKVERDKEIEEIKRKVGFDFGVGYPHDKRTIEFLKRLIKKEQLPCWVRKSWITVEELKRKNKQTGLRSFFKKII